MFEVILKKRQPGSKRLEDEWEFDDESAYQWDSPSARIMLICQRLQILKVLEFTITGFGPEPWHLEIGYDFSMVMEDLYDFLEWIDQGGRGVFQEHFHAFGGNRTLFFKIVDGRVEIECVYGYPICQPSGVIVGQPDPTIEVTDLSTLDEMYTRLLKTFVSEALHYFPEEAEDEYFKEWMQAPSIKRRLDVR